MVFQKGHTPWNKNTKGIMKSTSGSFKKGHIPSNPIKKGEHRGTNTEFKKGMISPHDEEHSNWKGDKVGVQGLHSWVKRKLGKANKCFRCGTTEDVQWANKSQEYKRDLDDWIALCRKCHWEYDVDLFKRNDKGQFIKNESRNSIYKQPTTN